MSFDLRWAMGADPSRDQPEKRDVPVGGGSIGLYPWTLELALPRRHGYLPSQVQVDASDCHVCTQVRSGRAGPGRAGSGQATPRQVAFIAAQGSS